MNARRRTLSVIGVSLLCLPCVLSFAQEPKKLRRVGVLAARRRPASLESDLMGEFPRALRDLGYTEGKNLSLEWRFAENQNERPNPTQLSRSIRRRIKSRRPISRPEIRGNF